MKKILFNDRYGLTEAVLSGRKTQTRRLCSLSLYNIKTDEATQPSAIFLKDGVWMFSVNGKDYPLPKWNRPKYKVGEEVAVAQCYKDIAEPQDNAQEVLGYYKVHRELLTMEEMGAGWTNKMFVNADLMPHRIRITNVRAERLQSISDDDCIKEGVYKDECTTYFNGYAFETVIDQYGNVLAKQWYKSPREAYAALIDRVSGKGTWKSNPWVFVYDFELIK